MVKQGQYDHREVERTRAGRDVKAHKNKATECIKLIYIIRIIAQEGGSKKI